MLLISNVAIVVAKKFIHMTFVVLHLICVNVLCTPFTHFPSYILLKIPNKSNPNRFANVKYGLPLAYLLSEFTRFAQQILICVAHISSQYLLLCPHNLFTMHSFEKIISIFLEQILSSN